MGLEPLVSWPWRKEMDEDEVADIFYDTVLAKVVKSQVWMPLGDEDERQSGLRAEEGDGDAAARVHHLLLAAAGGRLQVPARLGGPVVDRGFEAKVWFNMKIHEGFSILVRDLDGFDVMVVAFLID